MNTKVFTQMRNVEKDIEATLDGYKTKIEHGFWLADALQKDAIQNSWDARINKKGKDWKCLFFLKNINDKKFLGILDEGTKGLIGTQFDNEEELSKILLSSKPKEDLSHFLNSNWSTKDREKGGTRGRGKIVFLGASKDKKIFFDSLRSSDNRYVSGEIYLDKDKEVKFKHFWDEDAKSKLASFSNKKIIPLNKFGTRILISNPDSSVVRAIEEGDFLGFINDSRWEIIKKFKAKIFVDDDREIKNATVPRWYEDNIEGIDSAEGIRENKHLLENIKEKTPYKIKRLILRYPINGNLPESIRGIAIQRSGMTIQRIPADDLLKEEKAKNIYGWIEMDKEPLEEEMKSLEGAEHLDFSWRHKPANYLMNYIRFRIKEFAKELKLIEPEQAIKNKVQKTAAEKALKNLTPLFKKFDLSGKYKGGGKKRKQSTRDKNEPLRLSIPDFELPHENKRVNYGDKIKGTYVMPINDFERSFMVLVRVFVVSDDGRTKIIEERHINLYSGRGPKIGTEFIKIDKKIDKNYYKKGAYSLKAKMVSLEETDEKLPNGNRIEKGRTLYEQINRKFYIEKDPPESGPFQFQATKKEEKDNLFEWEEEDGNYIIYYNELHPKIKPVLEDEEKLSNYLTEQGALIGLQIAFEESVSENNSKDKDFSKLIKSENPNLGDVLPVLFKKYSEFLWDYLKEKKDGN